jgi:hydroxymethylpyrimidine/phosphomethylpyrimidine kinase
LIIAGSDSGGGAGIQADIKTVTALGGFATTAVTAITVQNSLGVFGVHPIPLDIVTAQARAVLDDLGADAIKTGMLGTVAMVETVCALLDSEPDLPAIIDPVMIAKGGHPLLEAQGIAAIRDLLVPRAGLLTPNAPEAAALTGLAVETLDDLRRAGEALMGLGAKAVLMKGGHLAGDQVTDLLITSDGETLLQGPRIHSRHTHGTGCTLASACAVGIAQGMDLPKAVERARLYVVEAMARAPGYGAGHGPLDHGWPFRPI